MPVMSIRDWKIALLYLTILPFVVVGTFYLGGYAIMGLDALVPGIPRSTAAQLSKNVVPRFVLDLLIYGAVANGLRRTGKVARGAKDHLRRAFLLYGVAVSCGVTILLQSSNPGFAYWAILPIFVGVAAAAGIVADAWVGRATRGVAPAA